MTFDSRRRSTNRRSITPVARAWVIIALALSAPLGFLLLVCALNGILPNNELCLKPAFLLMVGAPPTVIILSVVELIRRIRDQGLAKARTLLSVGLALGISGLYFTHMVLTFNPD